MQLLSTKLLQDLDCLRRAVTEHLCVVFDVAPGLGGASFITEWVRFGEQHGLTTKFLTRSHISMLESGGSEPTVYFSSGDFWQWGGAERADLLRRIPPQHTLVIPAPPASVDEDAAFTEFFASHHVDERGLGRFTVSPYSNAQLLEQLILLRGSTELSHADLRIIDAVWGRPEWMRQLLTVFSYDSAVPDLWFRGHLRPGFEVESLSAGVGQLIPELEISSRSATIGLVLANLPPSSFRKLSGLVSSSELELLEKSGVLISDPSHPELWGVPRILGISIAHLASRSEFAALETHISHCYIALSNLGVPLTRAEAHLLSMTCLDSEAAVQPPPGLHHVLKQSFQRYLCFGDGESAKSLLLLQGDSAPQMCTSERAQLATILQDPRAGLQSLLLNPFPQTNCVLPSPNNNLELSLLALRSVLSAEADSPQPVQAPVLHAESFWSDAADLLNALNTPLETAISLPEVNHHSDHPELFTLFGVVLHELEIRNAGVGFTAGFCDHWWPVIAEQLEIYIEFDADLRQLDLVWTWLLIAFQIVPLLVPEPSRSDQAVAQMVQLLQGDAQHLEWLLASQQAKVHALNSGMTLFFSECATFSASLPRFVPLRIREYISHLSTPPNIALGDPSTPGFTQMFRYLSHDYERIHKPQWPAAVVNGSHRHSTHSDTPSLAQSMIEHFDAHCTQNPVALQTAARQLHEHEYWGPAINAQRAALSIYQKRRASGKAHEAHDRLTELLKAHENNTPWYVGYLRVAPQEPLSVTKREQAIAELIVAGYTNKEIANQLDCSVRTIESHISNARTKFGLVSRHELGALVAQRLQH